MKLIGAMLSSVPRQTSKTILSPRNTAYSNGMLSRIATLLSKVTAEQSRAHKLQEEVKRKDETIKAHTARIASLTAKVQQEERVRARTVEERTRNKQVCFLSSWGT